MRLTIYYLSPDTRTMSGWPAIVWAHAMNLRDHTFIPDKPTEDELEKAFAVAIRNLRETGFRITPKSWVSPSAIIRIEVAE